MKAFIKDAPFGLSVIFIILAIMFVYIAAPIFGNSALIVRSGSMQPQIAVGDLAVVKKQADGNYKVGDIIAFKNANNSKTLTTHRIAGIENKNGRIFYQTKGDANKTVDREPVSAENVIGKAYLRLPYLGRLIAFTKTTAGFSLAVIFPAFLVIAFEIQNIFKEIKKQKSVRHEVPKQPEYPVVMPMVEVWGLSKFSDNKLRFKFPSLKVLLPLLASTLLVYNSFAYFSDTATSSNNNFTAAESFPAGPGDVVINEINWGGSSLNPNDEWVELRNMTSNSIDLTNWVVDNLGSGSSDEADLTISGTIPADGLFLISAKNKVDSKINVEPDLILSSMNLHNEGEQLVLRNDSGTEIDTANIDDDWFFGANRTPGPAKSMERNSTPGDGTLSTNWHTATTTVNFDIDATEKGTPNAAND